MHNCPVNSSSSSRKAQLKIQEMAFVLVAIMIFFALLAVIYLSVRFSTLRDDVALQREAQVKELARKLTAVPEFAWSATDCAQCLDADKIFLLKNRSSYRNFFGLDYLAVEWIYPSKKQRECTFGTYPDCSTLTLINKTQGTPVSAFVTLCRYEPGPRGYTRCELGKIYASGIERSLQ